MDEKDIELVKRTVKETVQEILETELYDNLCTAFTGLEAVCIQFRRSIAPKEVLKEDKSAVSELTFDLKYESFEGAKIGNYEVAADKNNIPEKYQQALSVLSKSNATISSRYHGAGYGHSYWIYNGRIFRQKLKR